MQIADYNAKLPVAINSIINKEGLKQRAVAQKANLNPREFNAMLNGRKIIKPCDVIAISNALGVNPGDLFTEYNSNSENNSPDQPKAS